jgi:hypothetical protein
MTALYNVFIYSDSVSERNTYMILKSDSRYLCFILLDMHYDVRRSTSMQGCGNPLSAQTCIWHDMCMVT